MSVARNKMGQILFEIEVMMYNPNRYWPHSSGSSSNLTSLTPSSTAHSQPVCYLQNEGAGNHFDKELLSVLLFGSYSTIFIAITSTYTFEMIMSMG
jgi:hypothetical protein